MGLGNQGKGSRFTDRRPVKNNVAEKGLDLRAGSGNSTNLELKQTAFMIDRDTISRLEKYVLHMKVEEGDSSVNKSYVARRAISNFLKGEGF